MPNVASRGWDSDFPEFSGASRDAIFALLQQRSTDASEEQIRAWRDSIPALQSETNEVLATEVSVKDVGIRFVLEFTQ
jgi:hypothetical protein